MDQFKLYVGNLSWNIDTEALRAFFAQVGEVVDAIVITDRMTGRSKGFGFVTMADQAGLDAALALNGQELDGRALKIDQARQKEE